MSEAQGPPVPAGWYPDPSGASQWRRWDGTSWAAETMPYGPPPPDPAWVLREQLTWNSLRVFAPLALVAPSATAVVLAAQTADLGPFRSWIQRAWNVHGGTVPPVPTVRSTPLEGATQFAVLFAVLIGLLAWSRFCVASVRVAALARYPQRHNPAWASFALLIPLLGPLVASSATRDSLPQGHEARRLLEWGWGLVLLGQLAVFSTIAVVSTTPSVLAAWLAAAASVVVWSAAAVMLPLGLGAIADDHQSLRARPAGRPS